MSGSLQWQVCRLLNAMWILLPQAKSFSENIANVVSKPLGSELSAAMLVIFYDWSEAYRTIQKYTNATFLTVL